MKNDHGAAVLQAAPVHCAPCHSCRAIHINLVNENGKIFATAVIPLDRCPSFIRGFEEEIKAALAMPGVTGSRQ